MNFWDSSALVPLLIEQKSTAAVEKLYAEERRGVFVWWGTYTECVSALARLEREHTLDVDEVEAALRALGEIAKSWSEILPSDRVRERANRMLRVHPLRTGDAFQLGSLVVASEDAASKVSLATFDERLAAAARKEGFNVLSIAVNQT